MRIEIFMCLCVAITSPMVRSLDTDQNILALTELYFGQRLFEKMDTYRKDVVFSPFGVHSTLTMMMMGAGGATEQEMRQTLRLEALPGDEAHTTYQNFMEELKIAAAVKVKSASAVYVHPNKEVDDNFMKDVQDRYSAKVEKLDFTSLWGPEKAINEYMKQMNEDMTKDMMPKGTIDPSIDLLVVNSVEFQGEWQDHFDHRNTQRKDFTKMDGTKSQVDMMSDTRYLRYTRDLTNQVDCLELPFKGERFGLYILLPHQANNMHSLEMLMSDTSKMEQMWEGLTTKAVQLEMPKFRIENKWELQNWLKGMGMTKAFDPSMADFSGISKTVKHHMDKFIHKATIHIREQGCNTHTPMVRTGVKTITSGVGTVETFRADHPFLFFLRDNLTKEMLLQGQFSG